MTFFRFFALAPVTLFVLLTVLILANEYTFARASRRTKDIAYVNADYPDYDAERHQLDVYAPTDKVVLGRPVVVFIHGGNWNSGRKSLYAFIGRRLAKQGVVAVVINYRLSPDVEVPEQADDCARAVRWAAQHISEYGGDPGRIFVMGHSAGGGLAALLATDDAYFTKLGLDRNPIKGAILDDPAGLDMYDYLQKMEYPDDEKYLIPFGKDPAVWRAVSALYHVDARTPPMLLFVGERTYPSIARSARKFSQRLKEVGVKYEFTELPRKKHIAMVTQLFWKKNIIYQDLLRFVAATQR
ncbi:alpha/beta hydrolase [Spirosoma oryzicola]|uniref:alpha/beta hydrolase n=1 Tax=Spirosoma oryzicola TaxID=2898794 RepID=UPI001E5600DE|nr:alpha/beta hydrolase [Spirosoma oryzicola]UHG89263.1 alpha/beta hydrolase [Spirosoma oryzicola]